MTVVTAYRSSNPAVLASFAANQAALDEFGKACDALIDEFPGEGRAVATWSGTHRRVAGLVGPEPDGPWRWIGDMWVPNRRTKLGRQLAQRLSDIRFAWTGLEGMPKDVFDSQTSRLYNHGCFELDGVVWAKWGCSADLVETPSEHRNWQARFDPAMWERAKLSAYYAAVEENDARREAATPTTP